MTVRVFVSVYLTPELRLGRRGQQEPNELFAGQRRVVIRGLRGLNSRDTCGGQTNGTEKHTSVYKHQTHTHTHLNERLQLFGELFNTKEASLLQHTCKGKTEG